MSSSPKITITIKLFAAYQEAYNVGELKRDFSPNTSILEVLNQLISERPELEKWRSLTRFGLNLQFVEAETLLQDGDEIVFIPPVSGG
ncbi:MAG: MoaD/ThiS family protein [Snowella sp.]|nr:MoaD/ThiS family protein [Snowella sp.]